jgi:hypothetical protein
MKKEFQIIAMFQQKHDDAIIIGGWKTNIVVERIDDYQGHFFNVEGVSKS